MLELSQTLKQMANKGIDGVNDSVPDNPIHLKNFIAGLDDS